MFTDAKRLQQIVKNLLSNAFKFTHHGHVSLAVAPATSGWSYDNEELNRGGAVLAFSVADTGIGIPTDKQQIIFEAFQQADGSTSRKYGGTGLGLAISRELSRLLGGEIRLISTPGKGSTFTLYLPLNYSPPRLGRKPSTPEGKAGIDENRKVGVEESKSWNEPAPTNGTPVVAVAAAPAAPAAQLPVALPVAPRLPEPVAELPEPAPTPLVNEVGDDRDTVRSGDRVLLIVENDIGFARFLLDAAREKGFKGLVTSLGATALALAREYKPDAITLDIYLPDMEGWRVFDRLKNDVATRQIPVCVISTDDARERALGCGSLTFVAKPIQSRDTLDLLLEGLREILSHTTKHVLVVEPDPGRRQQVLDYLAMDDLRLAAAPNGEAALQLLREWPADCLVLPAELPDLAPSTVAQELEKRAGVCPLPVIVHSDGLTGLHEHGSWRQLGEICTVHQAHSLERLLDQITYLLHLRLGKLPEAKRQILMDLYESNKALSGKKVLIVDDDMRNIFALSIILEDQDMAIATAGNGRDAITILQEQLDIDIVLMDIMMPEMDGFETMREIRKIPKLKDLPIIAVTAKAMKGDREKCIEAGAWDYLAKPVDTEQMLAVLRAWLHR
jgi:CheY-like chemotaxis protein